MNTIAIIAQKGGVGKTTTAVTLGAALGSRGRRVLVIDSDPHAFATKHLGCSAEHGSMADVLLDGKPISAIIVNTQTLGVALAPADVRLADATAQLLNKPGREFRLQRALQTVASEYDLVLIDCPPQLSLLSINALVAADFFVVPASADAFSISALEELLAGTHEIREVIRCAEFLGVVLTAVDYRTRLTRDAEEYLRTHLGDQVFRTVIRTSVKLREAQAHGTTIYDYDAKSTGAFAYAALAAEIEEKIS